MPRTAACILCLGLLVICENAHSRGIGRFVGGLVARGVASGATHGMRKSYTPDLLTVDQLAQCLKRADLLDQESEGIETNREALRNHVKQVDQLENNLKSKKSSLNRYSQIDVDDFNRDVHRYNSAVTGGKALEDALNNSIDLHNANVGAYNLACAKKYYADDMAEARKLAGI